MDDLKERVRQYNLMQLPGQPMGMHMGTAYLIQDLARHLATAEQLLQSWTDMIGPPPYDDCAQPSEAFVAECRAFLKCVDAIDQSPERVGEEK